MNLTEDQQLKSNFFIQMAPVIESVDAFKSSIKICKRVHECLQAYSRLKSFHLSNCLLEISYTLNNFKTNGSPHRIEQWQVFWLVFRSTRFESQNT